MTYVNSHDANGGERLTPSETATAAKGHSGNTLPAVAAQANALEMPGYDDWWTRAPVAPPWVLEARERDAANAVLREFGLCPPPAFVTLYESETAVSKRFDLTRDEATGAYGLTSPKSKASLHKATAHKVPFDTLEDFAIFRSSRNECNIFNFGTFEKDDVHVRTKAAATYYQGGFVVARSIKPVEFLT